MHISRRDSLVLLAGMGVSACGGAGGATQATPTPTASVPPTPTPTPVATPPAAAPAEPVGLNTLATARGLRVGSCFAWGAPGADRGSFANPSYAALLKRDCGILVGENEMKWQAIRPSATQFDFTRFDAMMDWATANNLPVRGHNLLWHQPKWMPAWEENHDFGSSPSREAERLLVEHVNTVCRRYGARIPSYDVVNEAVTPADGTLYQTALSRALGGPEATLDLAFHTARAAAPGAQLVYNDYMSWEPGNANHRAGVLRLLEGFKRRGVPVDALGVQSHLVTQGMDARTGIAAIEGEWRRFLDAVTAMGYKLVITELDVRDNNLPADIAPRDTAVADFTRGYLDVMFAYPALRDVLLWGMSDRYSWIEGFEPRKDGAKRRPCPYDADFAPKPMRAAISAAITAAPVRS
ncbi:endo-1,4-beta-xylanase [Sphingomonas prati]|uniref:Beta-xylanase n=1 Tax=Sphingomonas prati TaxID=1843237 RepID=A0A7W9BPQ2_9SPHN|nr:endo-1,4-beta-xylanase [Sphingomonas prati]MBB5727867.1 endo-1,4-beta-xylanase [Sphingomonas prati]GGE81450.1 beta-xylanase [Sphingomonas prati]